MSELNFHRERCSSHSSRPHEQRRVEYLTRGSMHLHADEYRGSSSSHGGHTSVHHTRERCQGAVRYLSRGAIQELAQSGSDEVLACVNDNEAGFLAAYSHDRYCKDNFMMKHLIKLLYLLSKARDFNRIASRTLARILSADGSYALFIMKLDSLIKEMIEDRGHIRRENPQCLDYLIEIGNKAVRVIPETVLNTYPLLVIRKTIQDLTKQGMNLDTLDQRAKSLEEAFKLAREEQSRQVSASVMDVEGSKLCVGEPLQHFTDVEILPSLDEVHSGDDKIYLRPNIVKGAYSNWEHYLDVQYRLLREDFVRPLRHGIQHYCTPDIRKQHSHGQDVKIYKQVHVLKPVCLFVGIGFEIQFDASRLSWVNWEHSQRLIYGSLLCLSNDNFKNSITFATVAKRDPILLKEGRLILKFEGNCSGFHFNPTAVYTMAESTAYFEAYRHILSKLRGIASQSDKIPFKSYIIGCEFSDIPPPSYSLHQSIHFDLSDILGVRCNVMLHDRSSWPSAQITNLDPSQLAALKMAITKEVSVIQGPPGTGKTFIGLKIVEAFLRNRSSWDRNKEAPILVVCYTNHALDQFLEGIQALSMDEKPNITRIGGRCKSEKLSSYILQNKVKQYQTGKDLPRALLRKLGESRNAMAKTKALIDSNAPATKDLGRLTELKSVMLPHHYQQLAKKSFSREIEAWLELCFPNIFSEPAESQSDTESNMVTESSEVAVEIKDDGVPDGYIKVDNEAKLMEDDRILEGEEIEFLGLTDNQERISTSGKRKSPGDGLANPAKRIKVAVEESKFEPIESFAEQRGGNFKMAQIGEAKKCKMISEGLKNEPMSPEEVCLVRNIFKLSMKKRWQLHNYWMKKYMKRYHEEAMKLTDQYEQACERHKECSNEIDKFVLRGSDVIGMTTTGTAKHHHVLKNIYPKVAIFEEAAEIFEAHIVTSLIPSIQQLVLIGDHKQLQPKPNCYDLDVHYKLSVSLFERLVRNNIPYVTLNVQHRMRPEISRLIHPSIYNDLRDHKTVQNYDSILGVARDVFIIDHCETEKANKDSDVTTHINVFEADYLVSLCRYLLRQGYQPCMITILTLYRGQLLELRKKMRREEFEGVRVAAVDDFQGEENDIILLSLVRSNPEKNIGFLSSSNRACVALSRAKKGLYVIGNLSMLRGKNKTVWPVIISDLEQQQCVGKALPLYCRVHQKAKVFAEVPEDFCKCPEGGCDQLCRTRLSCGHCCPRVCHPDDRNHTRYKCLKDCPKTLSCGHKCLSKCYECSSGCKPCSKLVTKIHPTCGQEVKMPCSADAAKYPCPHLCQKHLRCGHSCQNKCSEPCNQMCCIKVEKTLQCGHKVVQACHMLNSKISCPEKCNAILECEHPCAGTCGSCHMGRLHVRCRQNCGRQLVCGHTCDFPCASVCPPCVLPCNNFCLHSRCPKKCYEVCIPCMEPCLWRCKHFRCTQPCGSLCDRPCCDQPCQKVLKCGHTCIGLCGEKCPKLCRICDKDEVTETFFGTEDEEDARFVILEDCDHFFEVTSLDKWVDQTDNSSGDSQVKFPACPKCKTPVRKSLRYCNKVKEILKDVSEIKRKQLLPKQGLMQKIKTFTDECKSSNHFVFIANEVHSICGLSKRSNLHPSEINSMSVQITVLERMLRVKEIIDAINRSVASKLKSHFELDLAYDSLTTMKSFVMQDFLSSQQISEAYCEIRRISCMARLGNLLCKLSLYEKNVSPENQVKLYQAAQKIHESGWTGEKMTEESEKTLLGLVKEFSKEYGICELSEQERLMVVKAVGLKKGHWFRCSNGHYYCIGECGGAMEKAKCPECGVVIGGQQHRLAEDNYRAPEMES